MPRIVALSLLVVAVVLPSSPSHAAHGSRITVSTTVRGVILSLSLPRRSYPRNALVKVRVTLQNISHRTVMVGATSAPECSQRGPGVQVLGAGGHVLYPPAVPWVLPSCGPVMLPAAPAPGQRMHHAVLTILRGPILRGVASLDLRNPSAQTTTPPLRISFIRERPPTLTVSTTPSLGLVVAPSHAMGHSTFSFIGGSICRESNTGFGSAMPRWQPTGTSADGTFHLLAPCASPDRWVFAGGWLNHPAVELIRL